MQNIQPMFKDYAPGKRVFPSLFFIRRFSLVFFLIVTPKKTRIQMWSYGLISLIKLIATFQDSPYPTKSHNRRE